MQTSTVQTFEHTRHPSRYYLGHCKVLQVLHRDAHFQVDSIPHDRLQSGPVKVGAKKKKLRVSCWLGKEEENVSPRKRAGLVRISLGEGEPPSAQYVHAEVR